MPTLKVAQQGSSQGGAKGLLPPSPKRGKVLVLRVDSTDLETATRLEPTRYDDFDFRLC